MEGERAEGKGGRGVKRRGGRAGVGEAHREEDKGGKGREE